MCTASGVHGGVFTRNQPPQQQQPQQAAAGEAGNAAAMRNPIDRSRAPYLNYMMDSSTTARQSGNGGGVGVGGAMNGGPPPMMRTGISAWGLISLIVFVIVLGMACHYGIMCYPLFCGKDSNYYATMREASSTSSGTPLGNYEEKLGNYSSRSTTPSKSHE